MGSAVGGIASGTLNRDAVHETNVANKQINAEQLLAQKEENALDRYFQANEAQKAFDRNVEQWQRENTYNSPVEQLKRFEKAGVNPMLGLLGNNAMPAANSPQMQAAKGSNSSLPTPIPMQPSAVWTPFDLAKDLKDMTEAVKNVSESKKTSAETVSIQSTLDSLIKKMSAEADMAAFNSELLQMFGKKQASATLNETVERAFNYTNQALLAAKQGDTEEAKKQANLAVKELYTKEANLKQKDIDHYEERLNSQIELNASTARLNRAQAVTEDALRGVRKQLLGADYELTNNEALLKGIESRTEQALESQGLRYSERVNAIQKTAAERGLAQVDYHKAQELYPIAVKMYELDLQKGDPKHWMYYVDKVLGSLTTAAGAAAGAYVGSAPGKTSPKSVKGFR